ncbi:MAG: formylglycine-generating enzyme family protein [Planctomycetaceae bacterium]|nr:formylglycine-generating enzyme family protein [Planctomycetaceae bacterium]
MLGMKLNKIPAGTFPMGSPEDEMRRGSDEQQHQVTISKAFYMQPTEVTQEQWMAVMESEPWLGRQFTREGSGYAASYVSWNDAVAYCEKLSEIEDKTYRLPTEAEWEYACRAGTETAWSFGDDEKALGDYAWYQESAINAGEPYAHRVGRKKPNDFGLYDMHGNVWEWCSDYYRKDYYHQSPINYPQGPEAVSSHVLRGGSWPHDARTSRSAGRFASSAGSLNYDLGFRLVCELDDDAQLASGGNSDPSTMPVVDELDLLELATTMKNVREALEARDMDTAITELKKAQSLPQSPEYTAVVLRLAKMTELLNEFIKNSEDAINGFSSGSEIMCAGSTIVSVVKVSETKLVIRSGGQLKTYARNQLSIAIAMGIADTFFQNNKRTTSLKAAFVATHKMRSVSWITEAREWWESGPLPIETFNLYLIDRYNVQDASSKAEAPDNPLVRTIDLMESSPSYNLSVPYDGNVETSNITVQFDVTARGTEAFPSETVQTEPVAINKDFNAKIMLGEHIQPSVGNSPARKFKLVGNVLVRLSYDAKKQEFRIYVKPTADVGAGKINSTQVGLSAPQSEKRIEELQRTILKTTQEYDIVHPANWQRLKKRYQQLEDQRANAAAANNLQLAANIATEMNNVGAQLKVQLNLMTSKRNRLPAFHFNLAYLKSLTLKLANLKYLDIRYRIFQKIDDKHVLIIDGW